MAPSSLRQCAQDVSLYLILLITIATLGPLQFGFHLAELNAPQDAITCANKPLPTGAMSALLSALRAPAAGEAPAGSSSIPECIPMTPAQFATVSSAFTLGGLLGALAAGPFASSRGRRPAMRATAICFLLGSLVEVLSASVAVMAAGRLVAGIGAGAATVIVPLYISEVAPPRERGFFGAFTQISINVGILATQTLGYFLSHGGAWRWIIGTGVAIAALQGLALLIVPESPAWMATVGGDVSGAKRVLQRIRGSGVAVDEEVEAWGVGSAGSTAGEEEGLLADDGTAAPPAAGKATHGRLGFVQVVRDPLYRPAIIAVVGIMFAQQLCGINSIIMYSVVLLQDLVPINSTLLTIIISGINLVTTIACSPLPDRLGRKSCLLISIIGQGSSSLALALSIRFGVKVLSAFSVLFFVAFFAVGLGPVPFILASELVGQEAVGATQSWCLGANYVATFLVAQFFPIINVALNERFGDAGRVYFIFTAFACFWAVFVSWNVPETKDKKDADEVWGRTRRID